MENPPDRNPPQEIPSESVDIFAQQKIYPEDPCPTYISPAQAAALAGVELDQIEAWIYTGQIEHDGSELNGPLIDLAKFQAHMPELFDLEEDLTSLQIYTEDQ